MAPPNEAAPLMSVVPAPADPSRRPDPAALQPNIGALLYDVARLMRRGFERRARQSGLPITRQQARALLYIARNEGLSQAAVATGLDIEPIALVRLLDRLHEEGLVDRHPHPTDRRIRTLWLTPLAWEVIDRVLAINAAVRAEACAGLPPAAHAALMRALGEMKANLSLAEASESAAAE
ncbi:MAG TPA: MarR family winged helix-turn-helix transcriptional regulator [Stellaceae bacterium]|nr:MarR family winged helix-turn-helix transcriptional regulator [Stellaceae bacterium]